MPLFLIHKKGLVRDGRAPTLLYGYGGFNIPMVPGFSPAKLTWMEMGGIYAVAGLRGVPAVTLEAARGGRGPCACALCQSGYLHPPVSRCHV